MKVPTPAYRCALARLQPDPRPDPEQIKREGWRDQQILVISPDDTRLFSVVDSAEDGWAVVRAHYNLPEISGRG